MTFADKYGPWALVAGASEGVGAAFAAELAARGLNVVLLARRQHALDEVADAVESRSNAQTRTLVVDLSEGSAAEKIAAATADLDIGLLVYCAGSDTEIVPFLDNKLSSAEAMLQRNCLAPMQLTHHFGQSMVERGRGGIMLLSSGAAFVGAPSMAVYGATKAFDMIFMEGLWSELRDHGVDALGVVLGTTDTPALRRVRQSRGLAGPDEPVRGATSPQEVVTAALEDLGKTPTCMAGRQIRWGSRILSPIPRQLQVRLMAFMSRREMGGSHYT